MKNGEELWNFQTEVSFIRSQKKLSMAIMEGVIYFNNSLGDISAINIDDGQLIWQLPTTNNLIVDQPFHLKHPILLQMEIIYFFQIIKSPFSIDINQEISSG